MNELRVEDSGSIGGYEAQLLISSMARKGTTARGRSHQRARVISAKRIAMTRSSALA